ncbi:MAG: 50S ribosomal protein L24 [Oscillospiraceae bacterium]|jgi:large subunit ribosomal protein L24|nr:50S ribosomal protein L24 [Oscillospiraceae bacterium]
MNIRTNDTVIVLSGKDKGKQGKVLSADPKGGKVIVEGVNVAKRHQKPRKEGEEGGIIKKETPIYTAKVMRVCPKCDQPTRTAHKLTDKGEKVRVCKKCGAEI